MITEEYTTEDGRSTYKEISEVTCQVTVSVYTQGQAAKFRFAVIKTKNTLILVCSVFL